MSSSESASQLKLFTSIVLGAAVTYVFLPHRPDDSRYGEKLVFVTIGASWVWLFVLARVDFGPFARAIGMVAGNGFMALIALGVSALIAAIGSLFVGFALHAFYISVNPGVIFLVLWVLCFWLVASEMDFFKY